MIIIFVTIVTIIIYFILRKFMKKRHAVPIVIVTPILLFITANSLVFFFFLKFLADLDEKASAEEAEKQEILEYYSSALTEDTDNTFEKILSEVESNGTASGGTTIPNGDYQNTVNTAQRIEGDSLLHEIHNLIVKTANEYSSTRGYTYEFILGTNITESNGLIGNQWIPHISAPTIAVQQDPNFDLYTWSYEDLFNWLPRAERGFTHGSGDYHIGAFQVVWNDFNSSYGPPTGSWGKSQWGQFVNGSKPNNDGNGDGKSDPFNFYDAIKAHANHAKPKPNLMKEAWVKPGDGEQEMYTMLLAARYVGITAVKGSKNLDDGTLIAHNEWDNYVHVEGKNPHVDLMRHAYEEWKNNGPIYQEYKAWMEGQTTTSSNGPKSAEIIDKLYAKYGWKKSGTSQTYNHPGGGYTKIDGYAGQFVYYPFRVFWGGKIAAENIQKALNRGGN